MEWVARRLGLEEYETAFRENEITWRAQPNLTAEGLKELGCLAVSTSRSTSGSPRPARNDRGDRYLAPLAMSNKTWNRIGFARLVRIDCSGG